MALSEKLLRRPDFGGGIPIKLADGQEWFFAEPRIRFVPDDSEVGFQVFLALDDGGEFNRVASQYSHLECMDSEEIADYTDNFVAAELKMGRLMLERNYNLDLDQIQSLLQFGYNIDQDPVACAIRQTVLAVVKGEVPKPSAGGDAASPTPPAA